MNRIGKRAAADADRLPGSTFRRPSAPTLARTPFPSRSRISSAPAEGREAARRRRGAGSGRGESFPPAVAALIDARDPWCAHCGTTRNLHRHHRRIKGHGGDPRPHTDCACNGVRLCVRCHLWWAHKERIEAEAEGIVIPRAETGPWRRPLMLHTAADSGVMVWPTCDGAYLTEMPEGALAA